MYLKLEYACIVLGFGLFPATSKNLRLSLISSRSKSEQAIGRNLVCHWKPPKFSLCWRAHACSHWKPVL